MKGPEELHTWRSAKAKAPSNNPVLVAVCKAVLPIVRGILGEPGLGLTGGAILVSRGEVLKARFPHGAGGRGKKRPVVVVQAEFYKQRLRSAVVAQVTNNEVSGYRAGEQDAARFGDSAFAGLQRREIRRPLDHGGSRRRNGQVGTERGRSVDKSQDFGQGKSDRLYVAA